METLKRYIALGNLILIYFKVLIVWKSNCNKLEIYIIFLGYGKAFILLLFKEKTLSFH